VEVFEACAIAKSKQKSFNKVCLGRNIPGERKERSLGGAEFCFFC
jgi:hypothetical protein